VIGAVKIALDHIKAAEAVVVWKLSKRPVERLSVSEVKNNYSLVMSKNKKQSWNLKWDSNSLV